MKLDDVCRRHALSYMRFMQTVLHLEYMRQDDLLLLTDEPSNRRTLQVSASTASAGAGISDRFVNRAKADAYKKARQSVQWRPGPVARLAAARCLYPFFELDKVWCSH